MLAAGPVDQKRALINAGNDRYFRHLNSTDFAPCHTGRRWWRDGKISATLTCERGGDDFRQRRAGSSVPAWVRSIGPLWSRSNVFGHGAPFPSLAPNQGDGLTDAGKALIAACDERRILVDLSHLNRPASGTSSPAASAH